MLARILCPGPSLRSYDPGDFAGLTIGVNRAALAFACDTWAAADYPMVRDKGPLLKGNPSLLSRRQTVQDLKPPRVARFPAIAYVEDLTGPTGVPWQTKTLTCAMVSAAACGATRIEVYGCDWAGTLDYDGVAAGEDRTDARWAQERRDFDAVAAWLAGRNCHVARIQSR